MSLGFFEAVTAGLSRLTTRRCPSASLRLRANPVGLRPPWALPFAPVHPRGGGVRTLRLFPPTRNSHGGRCPPVMAIPRSSPTGLLRGLRTSKMSRFACSQRLASLRFGTKPGGFAPLGFIPHFAPSSLLTTAQRFYIILPHSPESSQGQSNASSKKKRGNNHLQFGKCVLQ